jgi:hypothetical protein
MSRLSRTTTPPARRVAGRDRPPKRQARLAQPAAVRAAALEHRSHARDRPRAGRARPTAPVLRATSKPSPVTPTSAPTHRSDPLGTLPRSSAPATSTQPIDHHPAQPARTEFLYPTVPVSPGGGATAGVKIRLGCPRRRRFLGLEAVPQPGAGGPSRRVTHCCHEHAGQIFGFSDRGPRAAHDPDEAEEVSGGRGARARPRHGLVPHLIHPGSVGGSVRWRTVLGCCLS